MTPLLEVAGLTISIPTPAGPARPVDGVSLTIARGETLALVGESGSGKTLTALSILRLLPPSARIEPGSTVTLDGMDVLALDPEELRRIRGRRVGMVFQDPGSSLNPVFTVGDQIAEGIQAHYPITSREAAERALALLAQVGIPDPKARYHSYPHQLSGGMRQRVMIAIALAGEPDLLIADEPTTALDVTVQAQILEVFDRLRTVREMAVLLIGHDLGVVAGRADRVAVMYAGQIVEEAPTPRLFSSPAHPYTRGLLASAPRLEGPLQPLVAIPGTVPQPTAWPAGCRFRPRCSLAMTDCDHDPPVRSLEASHTARCWLADG